MPRYDARAGAPPTNYLRFLWRRPLPRALTVADVLSNGIGAGLFTVMMLVYIEQRYDSPVLGAAPPWLRRQRSPGRLARGGRHSGRDGWRVRGRDGVAGRDAEVAGDRCVA